ncbi:MAG TPA: hypothetical protein VG899_08575 [Mycobacteriales bacterium]|nr:hypothetical protein [Mycobacteriales bacterium]HWA66408.1 hypothetical protein [Mycobacteriales bacterium]
MSFLITLKVKGDTAVFTKALEERAAEFEAVVAKSKAAGAIHHRFGLGDGYVHVIDEWETVEGFQAFFGEPSMQEFLATIGADTSSEPEITVSEALTTVDEF